MCFNHLFCSHKLPFTGVVLGASGSEADQLHEGGQAQGHHRSRQLHVGLGGHLGHREETKLHDPCQVHRRNCESLEQKQIIHPNVSKRYLVTELFIKINLPIMASAFKKRICIF